MTKKVLIMTQNFYPVIGSAGNRMKNIFQLLNQHGIETVVLTTEPAYPNKNLYKDPKFWDDEELNNENQKIIRVPIKTNKFSNHIMNRLFFYLEIMVRFLLVLWKIRKEKYDFIYVSTPPIFIVFSACIGKFFMKSKLILEVRDLWPDSLVGVKAFNYPFIINIFRMLEAKMYRIADYIVINSLGFTDHIKNKLKNKETPMIYLPNGPRESEITETKVPSSDFKVVYTGNLGLAQDIDRLKQIATMLDQHHIRFEVIGYGMKTDEFITYLKENNLNHVQVQQPTTRKKSLELIKNSNIAIAFLNNNDIFSTVLPGKIIDYMTCKTPIIAGIKGVAAELIEKNNAGYVFHDNEVEKMIEQIVYLKNDQEKQVQLGDNGLEIIKKEYLWEKNIMKLLDIINR